MKTPRLSSRMLLPSSGQVRLAVRWCAGGLREKRLISYVEDSASTKATFISFRGTNTDAGQPDIYSKRCY